MRQFTQKFFFFLLVVSMSSCTGKGRWSATEMWFMAVEEDPNVKQIPIPAHEQHRRVLCTSYGLGCVPGSGKRIELKGVEIVVVEFENEEFAKKEAYRLNQMYARNWLFDEVMKEPVVKSFIKRVYCAEDPHLAQNEKQDCEVK